MQSEQAPPLPQPLAPQQPQQEQLGLACLQPQEQEQEELLGSESLTLPSLSELDSSLLLEGGLDFSFHLPELHDLTAELEECSPAAPTPPQDAPGVSCKLRCTVKTS